MRVYKVNADRQIGEWLGNPEFIGEESVAEWNLKKDTEKLQHGTGGWIFVPENDKPTFYPYHDVILFPPDFSPTEIFMHPFTKGRTGKLIGAQ